MRTKTILILLMLTSTMFFMNTLTVTAGEDEPILPTVNIGEQLALDTIFKGLVNTQSFKYGNGTYSVYAAFRYPDGNVLQCDDETYLAALYEFEVMYE